MAELLLSETITVNVFGAGRLVRRVAQVKTPVVGSMLAPGRRVASSGYSSEAERGCWGRRRRG